MIGASLVYDHHLVRFWNKKNISQSTRFIVHALSTPNGGYPITYMKRIENRGSDGIHAERCGLYASALTINRSTLEMPKGGN